jgi:hypothetical protein
MAAAFVRRLSFTNDDNKQIGLIIIPPFFDYCFDEPAVTSTCAASLVAILDTCTAPHLLNVDSAANMQLVDAVSNCLSATV